MLIARYVPRLLLLALGAMASIAQTFVGRIPAEQLEPRALQGGRNAEYRLGERYASSAADRDLAKAVRWYRMAAEQGHVLAQSALGDIFARGFEEEGIFQDLKEASKWYLMGAEQSGNEALQRLFGLTNMLVEVKTNADFSVVGARANRGDAEAQWVLGHAYEVGRGRVGAYRDSAEAIAEAIKWYRMAAEQAIAIVQFELGEKYAEGVNGMEADYAEAAKWYLAAAEQGHPRAQFEIGNLYRDGRGVPQDWTEAARWYRMAAVEGHDEAPFNLGEMYYYGHGFPKDRAEAEQWYRTAAAQGYFAAHEKLRRLELPGWLDATLFSESRLIRLASALASLPLLGAVFWLMAHSVEMVGLKGYFYLGRASRFVSYAFGAWAALGALVSTHYLGDMQPGAADVDTGTDMFLVGFAGAFGFNELSGWLHRKDRPRESPKPG